MQNPKQATPAAAAVPVMTRHRTKDDILHFLTKEQMAAEIIRLDAALAAAATTQEEPAFIDSTPELHVGGSAFESWYSDYLLKAPVHQPMKQRARDAYAAGMGDPLVVTAPAAVAGPSLEQLLRDARHRIANLSRASVPFDDPLDGPVLKALDAAIAAAPTTQAAPQQEPVAWRHSKTLRLYETKAEVPLADGDEWAEPLCLAAQHPAPVAQGNAEDAGIIQWILDNAGEASRLLGSWCDDRDATREELHGALTRRAARSQAKEGGAP